MLTFSCSDLDWAIPRRHEGTADWNLAFEVQTLTSQICDTEAKQKSVCPEDSLAKSSTFPPPPAVES